MSSEEVPEPARRFDWLVVALVMTLTTIAVWAPFASDLSLLYRYWDGPHYAYLAKTLYDVPENHPFQAYQLKPAYWALHFPLYSLVIRAVVIVSGCDYGPAMLFTTWLTAVAAALLFHRLLREWKLVRSPLWTALLFAVLPPRWLIYHSVGASEPLFLVCVFAAFLAFGRGRFDFTVIAVAAACLTRIHGALLIPTMMIAYALKREWRRTALMPIAGLSFLGLFGFHYLAYGDALAYVHQQVGERGLLHARPFELLQALAGRPEAAVTEHLIGLFLLYGIGTAALWGRPALLIYCAAFWSLNAFVFHDDLSRYFLPIAPFALLVGFDPVLRRPAVRFVAFAAGGYLGLAYAWGYVRFNIVDEGVWRAIAAAISR